MIMFIHPLYRLSLIPQKSYLPLTRRETHFIKEIIEKFCFENKIRILDLNFYDNYFEITISVYSSLEMNLFSDFFKKKLLGKFYGN